MALAGLSPEPIRFGSFEVNLDTGELRKAGVRIRLQEQPFQVLAALLENPGKVVTREELVRKLWPDGVFVDYDRGLNAAVARLRQSLSDSAESPRYIETVARRGYRFLGTIESESAPVPIDVPTPAVDVPTPAVRKRWVVPVALAGVVTVAVALVWLVSAGRGLEPDEFQTVPLTSEPGYESNPSFSPDGSQVAFEWNQGKGGPHIYVKVTGAGNPVRLTSSEAAEVGPSWSRDGRQIAFLRARPGQNGQPAILTLCVVPAVGGVERCVIDVTIPFWVYRTPLHRLDWMPDNRHVVVSGALTPRGGEQLLLVDMETGRGTPLMKSPNDELSGDREPSVSPDGRRIAFTRGTLSVSEYLYVLPLTADFRPAGEPIRLTSDKNSQSPVWISHGREILFLRAGRLSRIPANGGALRAIPSVRSAVTPAVSQSGSLAFAVGYADSNIWRLDLGNLGAPPKAPLIASTARDQDAQYSPDGTRIALQSTRSGYSEIWVCDSDGGRCAMLTNFARPYITGSPRWSPDGSRIAFDSAAGGGSFQIYVVDAKGGSARRLSSEGENGAIPSWSRDGKSIYFACWKADRNEICKVPAEGGTSVQLTRNGGMTAFEFDGRLYYTKSDTDARLFRSGLDGSGEVEVLNGIAQRGFVFAPNRIFYVSSEGSNQYTIRRFTPSTREDRPLLTVTTPMYLGLSLSPDGRFLVYTQIDSQAADLMLVSNFR